MICPENAEIVAARERIAKLEQCYEARIAELDQECDRRGLAMIAKDRRIAKLEAEVAELRAEIEQLKAEAKELEQGLEQGKADAYNNGVLDSRHAHAAIAEQKEKP